MRALHLSGARYLRMTVIHSLFKVMMMMMMAMMVVVVVAMPLSTRPHRCS